MNMIRIACIGIAGVVLALFLKQSRSPYAELISMAVCLLILFYSFGTLTGLFELLWTLERSVTVPESYIRILLKITGITYVADFSSRICEDAGYKAIAGQIEVFGKLSVLAGSAPILIALLETVSSLF